MKKLFLSFALATISLLGLNATTPDVDADINDWGYVEDGMIFAKVFVENANGVTITLPDDETPIEVTNGMNVIKVPVNLHAIVVKAVQDFKIVNIKVGDKNLDVADAPITVDCALPATIYITAQDLTTFIAPTIIESERTSRYIDFNGCEVTHPQPGRPYICIYGKTISKIIYKD